MSRKYKIRDQGALHFVTFNKFIDQKLNYIHNNAVEAGIVRHPEEYLYSSAGNYARLPETLIDVILI